MIDAPKLTAELSGLLVGWTTAQVRRNGGLALLTPAEYPGREGVVVYVDDDPAGGYAVTDNAQGEANLLGDISSGRLKGPASAIAERHQVEFRAGRVQVLGVPEAHLAEACWRVAQASAAIAEAQTFLPPDQRPRPRFSEMVANWLERTTDVVVERERAVYGLSGHQHRASLFLPPTETVLEPISGRKSWSVATSVYAEFGDLSQVNGYRLVAVLDDREVEMDQEAKLLSQVGKVARWSTQDEWRDTVTRD